MITLLAHLLLAYSPGLPARGAARPAVSGMPTCGRARSAPPALQFDFNKMGEDFGKMANDLGKTASDIGKTGSDMMSTLGLGGEDSGLSKEESDAMEGRLRSGKMNFDDFLKQVGVMQKAGSMQAILNKGPWGGDNKMSEQQMRDGQKKLERYGDFVKSMEADERDDPSILIAEAEALSRSRDVGKAPRLARIAEASGVTIEDVGGFVKEFEVRSDPRRAGRPKCPPIAAPPRATPCETLLTVRGGPTSVNSQRR